MQDIGILVSLDPIAIDQACLDLVYASDDPGRDHLLERIESRHGVHTIEAAAALGFGQREYELITLSGLPYAKSPAVAGDLFLVIKYEDTRIKKLS
jgi:hypothetical protein